MISRPEPLSFQERTVNLLFADNLLETKESEGLTLGEKIFLIQATREAAEIPYSFRPRSVDKILFSFFQLGVIDYRNFNRDPVSSPFYENPGLATKEFDKM